MPHTVRIVRTVRFTGFQSSLQDVRIGVYKDWFSDAPREVVAPCEELLRQFAALGAQLVDVTIPDLRLIAIAHAVTIHSEMAANMRRYALSLFPGKEMAWDLIYKPRLQRLMHERFGMQ